MLSFLARIFIPDRENYRSPAVRSAYGVLCSVLGIALNLVLFAGKYIAGVLSGSIAISADSFNNLSDAGSSLISLIGFRLAAKKPDPDHPFGHGRMEYLSGLAVSVIIILMGVELAKTSAAKIISPKEIRPSLFSAGILLASICVKLYMGFYNRAIGKKISSPAMVATATDSLSDCISTLVVLLSMLVARFTGLNIDGWVGAGVSLLIIWAGISSTRDTVSPLLGKAPEKEFVDSVENLVMAHGEVCGIHDLIVHDYGPGRVIVSLHAEVDGDGNIYELHDAIDNIETELHEKLGCLAVVHMDPIDAHNEALSEARAKMAEMVREIDPALSIHDFRMVPGPSHTNYIFDVLLPMDFALSDEEVARRVRTMTPWHFPGCKAVVNIDRSYV